MEKIDKDLEIISNNMYNIFVLQQLIFFKYGKIVIFKLAIFSICHTFANAFPWTCNVSNGFFTSWHL